jgi:hypothetical protein
VRYPTKQAGVAIHGSTSADRGFVFDVRVSVYGHHAFDKYSSAMTPAAPALVCHRDAGAGDFARSISTRKVHRPASRRVAPPNAVLAG